MTNTTSRRLFVPEIVQTSAMDCGPASLKCLLEGFGIPVSYGRLREACQTDVDGTSLDTMEEVALQLGLQAEQIMIPPDHLFIQTAQALPAIIVIRLPNNTTHFIVVWRTHGPLVQVMDPGMGRRWITKKTLLKQLYIHRLTVPTIDWRTWAATDEFLAPLKQRLTALAVPKAITTTLLNTALTDSTWRSLAALDAATRMAADLVQAKALRRGQEITPVLQKFFQQAINEPLLLNDEQIGPIPERYWLVQPVPSNQPQTNNNNNQPSQLFLQGAIMVRALGRQAKPQTDEKQSTNPLNQLSPELVAALNQGDTHPSFELWQLLKQSGIISLFTLAIAFILAAVGLVIEILFFRGLLDMGQMLGLLEQRLTAFSMLIIFLSISLAHHTFMIFGIVRLGRHLEARLRIAFLEKIPRLNDRYFQSRLISDMAERSHSVYRLRLLGNLSSSFLRIVSTLFLTVVGIAWLNPPSAPLALLSAILAIALPLAAQTTLNERDLRVRSFIGALSRFYLDSLLGLVPIRTHVAEQAIEQEHEGLLLEWAKANLGLYRTIVSVEALQMLTGFGLAVWLLWTYLAQGGQINNVLLLTYWALNLPILGQQAALIARQYPMHRNTTLRLLEPLGAKEEKDTPKTSPPMGETSKASPPSGGAPPLGGIEGGQSLDNTLNNDGITIKITNVNVVAAGHTILNNINLNIQAGSHIAIVGRSGAGKSSLVGLLLGWHRPATGQILVDGQPLEASQLDYLREQTVWVDPMVQLWNKSLLNNLNYGQAEHQPFASSKMGQIIQQADLQSLLEQLPQGLQTELGEGGALVSGGEGQRVRLGRAMFHPNAKLIILDEPFRGLDRTQRRKLLTNARKLWQHATLLCITHDIKQTQNFKRVLVIENGTIVEDDTPTNLCNQPNSRYLTLLNAETIVRETLWTNNTWHHLYFEDGKLTQPKRETTND